MMLRRSSSGFTMIEIMVVTVMIMGLLVMIGPRIAGIFQKSAKAKIQFKMIAIKDALQEYRLTFDTFPTTKEGLRALIQNPRPNEDKYKRNADKWPLVGEENLIDDQGNEFVYHCPPEKNKKYKFFELIYLGQTQSEDDKDRLDDGL